MATSRPGAEEAGAGGAEAGAGTAAGVGREGRLTGASGAAATRGVGGGEATDAAGFGAETMVGARLSKGDRFNAQTMVMAVRPVAKARRANHILEKPFFEERFRPDLLTCLEAVFFPLVAPLPVPFALAADERDGDFPLFFVVLPVIVKPRLRVIYSSNPRKRSGGAQDQESRCGPANVTPSVSAWL